MAEQDAGCSFVVVQSVCGVFHHFDLARELEKRGYLRAICSTFPWRRLAGECVPRNLVHTFPWIHTPQMLLGRRWRIPAPIDRAISWRALLLFDSWVARRLPPCDVFVAISCTGLTSGPRAQSLGAKYVCDRGSSHIRFQNAILAEEYSRWGFHQVIVDPHLIAREEAEYEQADAITVPSEFSRRTFIEMGVAPEKLHKIPYGVRLDRFQRVAELAKNRFEPETSRLGRSKRSAGRATSSSGSTDPKGPATQGLARGQITSSTTAAVTFAVPMSTTPTQCTVTPTGSTTTTGAPFVTSPSQSGFTVNVPTSGTLSGTYYCTYSI